MPRRAQQVAALVIVLGVLIADATSQYTYSRKVSEANSHSRAAKLFLQTAAGNKTVWGRPQRLAATISGKGGERWQRQLQQSTEDLTSVSTLTPPNEQQQHHVPRELSAPEAQDEPTLPQECLTYESRYRHAGDTARMLQLAEDLDPQGTKVVLLKVHLEAAPDHDLVSSMQALAIEAMEAGYHFYILLQGREHGTRAELLLFLPPGLRQFLVVHDYSRSMHLYPHLAAALHGKHPASRFLTETGSTSASYDPGPGLWGAYIAEVAFMRQYRKYDFLWVMEYDVRYTGHWGRFLEASMALAHHREGLDWEALMDEDFTQQGQLPGKLPPGPADLILYGRVGNGDKFLASAANLNITATWDAFVMVYGGSRRLFDTLHTMSLAGQSLYIEALLPTAAFLHNLKAVSLPEAIASWGSYHCCTTEAEEMYRDFAANASCTSSKLLHPIKRDVTGA